MCACVRRTRKVMKFFQLRNMRNEIEKGRTHAHVQEVSELMCPWEKSGVVKCKK